MRQIQGVNYIENQNYLLDKAHDNFGNLIVSRVRSEVDFRRHFLWHVDEMGFFMQNSVHHPKIYKV